MTNEGTSTLYGWTVQLTMGSGMRIVMVWNARVSQAGQQVLVEGTGDLAVIPPGGSVTVGMMIAGDPTGWEPNPRC